MKLLNGQTKANFHSVSIPKTGFYNTTALPISHYVKIQFCLRSIPDRFSLVLCVENHLGTNSRSCLPCCALRQRIHSQAMRPSPYLEDELHCGAISAIDLWMTHVDLRFIEYSDQPIESRINSSDKKLNSQKFSSRLCHPG